MRTPITEEERQARQEAAREEARQAGPEKAFFAALRKLQLRMMSSGELRDALLEKGYEPDTVEACLLVLQEKHYLNDDLYAEALLRRYRKKSRPAVMAALRAHKLEKECIQRAMEGWEPDGEHLTGLLEAAVRKEQPQWSPGEPIDRQTARKAAAKLYRRGFDRQQVQEAFAALDLRRSDYDMDGEYPYEP